MKINSKNYPEIIYEPFKEIWFGADQAGIPFSFDVSEDITGDINKMNIVGNVLDNVESIKKMAFDTFAQILTESDNKYYETVSCFLELHRNAFDEEQLAELLGKELTNESFLIEVLRCLKINRLGSYMDEKLKEQAFILDFTFNTDLTNEILALHFNTKKEVVSIAHES